MTHHDEGHYAAKHPNGTEYAPEIEAALKDKAEEGKIPCESAHQIADRLKITPAEVGRCADLLELRLNKCLLGLFGYTPQKKLVKAATQVSPDLESAIKNATTEDKISCLDCWAIAAALNCPKMEVANACEAMSIKIVPCQLGAF
jgi:hypothetical protein